MSPRMTTGNALFSGDTLGMLQTHIAAWLGTRAPRDQLDMVTTRTRRITAMW